MDELNMKVNSVIMRSIVEKLVSRAIRKKMGYKVDISLADLSVSYTNGTAKVHINADAEMDGSDIVKLLKTISED